MPAEPGPKTPLRLPRAACFPLLFVLLLAGIPLGIVAFTEVEPRERDIFPFDATIMNPNNKTTIPAIAFLLPGFVFSFILLAFTEFYVMRPQLDRQLRIDNYAQAVVYLLTGFLAHICVQQLSSVLVRAPIFPAHLQVPKRLARFHVRQVDVPVFCSQRLYKSAVRHPFDQYALGHRMPLACKPSNPCV